MVNFKKSNLKEYLLNKVGKQRKIKNLYEKYKKMDIDELNLEYISAKSSLEFKKTFILTFVATIFVLIISGFGKICSNIINNFLVSPKLDSFENLVYVKTAIIIILVTLLVLTFLIIFFSLNYKNSLENFYVLENIIKNEEVKEGVKNGK